jgi:hypothetical protein
MDLPRGKRERSAGKIFDMDTRQDQESAIIDYQMLTQDFVLLRPSNP